MIFISTLYHLQLNLIITSEKSNRFIKKVAEKKTILIIIGSASTNSSNHKLADAFLSMISDEFDSAISVDLKTLPHFDPELSGDNAPDAVIAFRNSVQKADGILICTPEYIFSIPSGLKNAIEWCVSTTVFSDKPIGLITAAANGQRASEELQLIMRTVMTSFTEDTTLLIQGIKGKISQQGEITDAKTRSDLMKFVEAFKTLLKKS